MPGPPGDSNRSTPSKWLIEQRPVSGCYARIVCGLDQVGHWPRRRGLKPSAPSILRPARAWISARLPDHAGAAPVFGEDSVKSPDEVALLSHHRPGSCRFNQKGLAVLSFTAYIRPSLGNGRRPNGAGLKGLAKLERLR